LLFELLFTFIICFDSGAVMVASVFMTIRNLDIMTKMVWPQGGHTKRRILYWQIGKKRYQ